MDDRKDGAGFVFGLLVGALVGASIAVILAPQSGADTREDLKHRARDLQHKANDLVAEMADDAGEWVEKGKQVIGKAFQRQAADEARILNRYSDEPAGGATAQ
ncbi:MAG: YtxH domain-containing protein [Proteobacteria bacterium]|nr:YtxH domain-containing protein [Pseudomonadota bacterium]